MGLDPSAETRVLKITSKSGSIGSTPACGPRDPSLNPTWEKKYKQILLDKIHIVAYISTLMLY